MTELDGIYRCGVCGNVVEVLDNGAGDLLCCGQPMRLLTPRTGDSATETHVPFVDIADGRLTVRLGESEAHPMDRKHFIQWISVTADGLTQRKSLSPGDEPKATFAIGETAFDVRAMCNRHGLWRNS